MSLREGYISAAVKLLELAKAEPIPATEAGARNNANDRQIIQTIHDHAMALGAACAEPDADDMAESAGALLPEGLKLCESAATLEPIVLREARADYEIKLIAPGKGSSAFYPAEVLRRDGPKVFKSGTHVYLNHPTRAEEAARPEGDVTNLAGVLTTDAVYHEAHAKGPGLYGRMKVFADHAQTVEEKAAHVGMSIRASGIAESGKKQDGLPILKELTGAESVDVVTRAGAGGMILTEAAVSAPPIPTQEADAMTADEAKKLVEAAVSAATAPLIERALKGDAREEATRILADIELPAAAKTRIIERATATLPLADGKLDTTKLRESIVQEAKGEAEYIASIGGRATVRGMGASAPVAPKPEDVAAREAASKSEYESDVALYESLGMERKAAEFAAKGRAA